MKETQPADPASGPTTSADEPIQDPLADIVIQSLAAKTLAACDAIIKSAPPNAQTPEPAPTDVMNYKRSALQVNFLAFFDEMRKFSPNAATILHNAGKRNTNISDDSTHILIGEACDTAYQTYCLINPSDESRDPQPQPALPDDIANLIKLPDHPTFKHAQTLLADSLASGVESNARDASYSALADSLLGQGRLRIVQRSDLIEHHQAMDNFLKRNPSAKPLGFEKDEQNKNDAYMFNDMGLHLKDELGQNLKLDLSREKGISAFLKAQFDPQSREIAAKQATTHYPFKLNQTSYKLMAFLGNIDPQAASVLRDGISREEFEGPQYEAVRSAFANAYDAFCQTSPPPIVPTSSKVATTSASTIDITSSSSALPSRVAALRSRRIQPDPKPHSSSSGLGPFSSPATMQASSSADSDKVAAKVPQQAPDSQGKAGALPTVPTSSKVATTSSSELGPFSASATMQASSSAGPDNVSANVPPQARDSQGKPGTLPAGTAPRAGGAKKIIAILTCASITCPNPLSSILNKIRHRRR